MRAELVVGNIPVWIVLRVFTEDSYIKGVFFDEGEAQAFRAEGEKVEPLPGRAVWTVEPHGAVA